MEDTLAWGFAAVAAVCGGLHAAAPEHDHPFRMLAGRLGRGRSWALCWVAAAAGMHLATSLVLGWICHQSGVGLLEGVGARGLHRFGAAWCLIYALAVGFGRFTGHLQSPRTSLLRLEERRMKALTPPSLATIEGLNPCLLPWALWMASAPAGLAATLFTAAAWSVAVSAVTAAKILLRFPRHPRPVLGPLERRADLLAGLVSGAFLLIL